MYKQKRNTVIFLVVLLLAGVANFCSRTGIPAWDSLMTCTNYVIYTGLLLFWIEAVRIRLLPSGVRTCIVSAAVLMLCYMLIRIFKYRFAVSVIMIRYAVYAYWIPQMLIPAFFLMTCVRIRKGGRSLAGWNEWLPLFVGIILSIVVMTNDIHQLVYVPKISLSQFMVDSGTYTYGPVLYICYIWMILALILGLGFLFRETGQVSIKVVRLLTILILWWFGIVVMTIMVIDRHSMYHFWNVPEIHIFCLLGVFEICLRYRLIPYNENYAGFFKKLQIPAVITDREFHILYRSETALSADPPGTFRIINRSEAALSADQSDMQEAINAPVLLTADMKLYGKEIRAGYAFWAEDESAIHQAQERLIEANDMIEQENDLIRAETEQKERDAYLQSRHHIYHDIAEKLYPCQMRIGQLLEEAVPGADDFREKISRVSVLNAYVKRKTNLLLLAAEHDLLHIEELFLALQESANYLTLAGLQTTALRPEDALYPAEQTIALYDAFEQIAEQLVGNVSSLMIAWNGDGLRLAAETEHMPDTDAITLPVKFQKSEDVLYMDILAGKDGEVV